MLVNIIKGLKEGNDFCHFLFPSALISQEFEVIRPVSLAGHAPRFSGLFCSHGMVGLSFCLSLSTDLSLNLPDSIKKPDNPLPDSTLS